MKKRLLVVFMCISTFVFAQDIHRFEDAKGNSHLCGEFPLKTLEKDEAFQEWFVKNYDNFPKTEKQKWAKKLKDVQVDIYLGTWCGDSKRWVPRFVKIWDDLGLKREQLNFIALYNSSVEGKYKQGPNGEEKGKKIHRVPTFIFKKDNQEIARIVETPNNTLETDLKQIAFECPSEPNYRAATYILDAFQGKTVEQIKMEFNKHYSTVYYKTKNRRELNTLGYVFLEAGKVQEALIVLKINTYMFQHDPNVYDSYAEALAIAGETEKAIDNYRKVLLLDRSNENAQEKLQELYKK
ncbi:tetratricopeptide repeat protein [Aureivirga marina]|uniref:tetratricopeptide repeat protein n=1 Tax=Aureivirga marina TaxID=1182451 RepID=UPI0018C8EDC1|nr:hypothetical protein [Aureivirga marina]